MMWMMAFAAIIAAAFGVSSSVVVHGTEVIPSGGTQEFVASSTALAMSSIDVLSGAVGPTPDLSEAISLVATPYPAVDPRSPVGAPPLPATGARPVELEAVEERALAAAITPAQTPNAPLAAELLERQRDVPSSAVLSPGEAGLLGAMNVRRVAAGLPPLQPSDALTRISRQRSGDMIAGSYFSHVSPTGGTWYSLMAESGLQFSAGGENLAKVVGADTNRTVELAMEKLMGSPTHRANILNPLHRYVGVGAVNDGGGVTIFASIFSDRESQATRH